MTFKAKIDDAIKYLCCCLPVRTNDQQSLIFYFWLHEASCFLFYKVRNYYLRKPHRISKITTKIILEGYTIHPN